MTFFLILYIGLAILVVYQRHKQDQIVNLSHTEIIILHRKAYIKYRNWLIYSILSFIIGYIMSEFCTMYETEKYTYWLFGTQEGTREVLTANGWISYILRVLGFLIGFPCLLGFIDRAKALSRYKTMTNSDYMRFQQIIHSDIVKQEEEEKRAKKINTVIKIIGKIINS